MLTEGMCVSAKVGFLAGRHRDGDQYRMALYKAQAPIGPDTEAYTTDGEVVGDGYEAGGRNILNWRVMARARAARSVTASPVVRHQC